MGDGTAAAAGSGGGAIAGEGLLTGESADAGVVAFDSPGTNTSTEKVNERCSPGCSAPTFTICRATSSPFSFLIETRTEYSHAWPTLGWRTAPSRLSAEKLGAGVAAAPGSNLRCFRHAGQVLALCRITARQCGQSRVAPAGARNVFTRACLSPA